MRESAVPGSLASWRHKASDDWDHGDSAALSNTAIWPSAAAGDRDSFSRVYLMHAGSVYAYCRRRVASVSDAEDITAEVFTLAWQRRLSVTVDEKAGILPWLLAVAKRVLFTYYRGTSSRTRVPPSLTQSREQIDIADQIVDADEGERYICALARSLERLRPEDRRIIELRYLQEIPMTIVANILGVPPTTARTRLFRALRHARESFITMDTEASLR